MFCNFVFTKFILRIQTSLYLIKARHFLQASGGSEDFGQILAKISK